MSSDDTRSSLTWVMRVDGNSRFFSRMTVSTLSKGLDRRLMSNRL